MRTNHECPDLEVLAAFADGHLDGGERAAMVDHLATCEACHELLVDILAVEDELTDTHQAIDAIGERLVAPEGPAEGPGADDSPGGARILPFVPRRWMVPGGAVAAVAAAAMLVFVLLPGMPDTTAFDGFAQLVESDSALPARLAEDWEDPAFSGSRSLASSGAIRSPEISFRLGVELVDLKVAVAAGNMDLITNALKGLQTTAGRDTFLESRLRSFEDKLPASDTDSSELDTAALLLDTQELGRVLGNDSLAFAFGQWAEAGRLAARAGQADYFDGRILSAMPPAVRQAEIEWQRESEVQSSLAEIEARLGEELDTETLPRLGRAFGRLVDVASSY